MTKTNARNSAKSLKHRLIEVSEAIIEEKGLSALSLRAAARAAGVSHMAPYRHFDDKDALLAAVAGNGFHGLATAMAQSTAGKDDPVDRLRAIGTTYVYFAYCHPGLFRLMFSAGIADRGRFGELAAAGEIAFSVCENAVADCNTGDNALSEDTLRLRALSMWSLVHGLGTLLIDDHINLETRDPLDLQWAISSILEQSRGWQ